MAVVTQNLWAKPGSIRIPGGADIPFWGFATTAGREPQLPGPTITARVGDLIRINLRNDLQDFVSLVFPGQDTIPAPVKNNGQFVSYNTHASPGGTVQYSFGAVRPGVFLYESGTNPERQVPMGLYGAIVVYPAEDGFERTAYGENTGTGFDVEKLLVLSEIDTRFNQATEAGRQFNLLDFSPDYWLVNGRSFPHTLLPDSTYFLPGQPVSAKINCVSGQRVLLRCINAGVQNHTFRLGETTSRVVAVDSRPLNANGSLDATYLRNTLTVASGESYDLILTAGATGQRYLHDRDVTHLCNTGQFPGGMATRLDVMIWIPWFAPPAPWLLNCRESGGSIHLSWINWATNVEGFVVERRTLTSGFQVIAVLVVPGMTFYVDNTVEPSTTYIYRIRAYNANGFSGYSNHYPVRTGSVV